MTEEEGEPAARSSLSPHPEEAALSLSKGGRLEGCGPDGASGASFSLQAIMYFECAQKDLPRGRMALHSPMC